MLLDQYAPRLPDGVRERMGLDMSDLIQTAVDANRRRDENLIENYMQLMRVQSGPTRRPWRKSCDLIDPLVFEHHIALFASLRSARVQRPYWLFEPTRFEDEKSAQGVEKALSTIFARDGFDSALYDSDWISLRDGCANMYIGWQQKTRKNRTKRYREKGTDDLDALVTEELKVPDVEYDEVPYLENIDERAGLEFTVEDLTNFYMMAPDAQDIESSIGCGTRRYLTANDLWAGIAQWGFEEDEVRELIDLGPTGYASSSGDGEYKTMKDEVAGTETKEGIGYWEVFRWFGKFPLWTKHGGLEVPDHLREDEFLWIVCPAHQKCLRFSYSPFMIRPYAQFKFLREPNGQGAESLPSMIGPHQDEATAWLRMGMDSSNLRSVPMFKQSQENAREFGNAQAGPGFIMLYKKSPNEVETFTWDHQGLGEQRAWLGDCRERGRAIPSGEGFGQLQNKVRKNKEMEGALAGVSAKLGLFVRNQQASGMERAAVIGLSHLQQYGSGDTFYQRGQRPTEVNPEDWKRFYSIKPRGTAADADPEVRLGRAKEWLELLRTSPIYQQKLAAGDVQPEYHALHDLAVAMDILSPESYLGEEPPPPDYMQAVAQAFAQIYNAQTQLQADPSLFLQNPALREVMAKVIQANQASGPTSQLEDQNMPEAAQGGNPQQNGAGTVPAMVAA